jgi:hypothetical protein
MRTSRLLIALLLGVASTCFAQEPTWTQKCPPTRPPARYAHDIAYDAARGQVVMFGGGNPDTNTIFNDTWVWDGTTWTQKFPAMSPLARTGHAMAYDAAHGQVVLFGGFVNGSPSADTWVWDGVNWTQKFPTASPSPTALVGMTYDAVRHQVVLFGGGLYPNILGETWVWDGSNWTRKIPTNSPPPRADHHLAFDAARGKVLLFGSWNGVTSFDDTWTWDGSNWTQHFPATSPPSRFSYGIVYDASVGKIVLFGGEHCGDSNCGSQPGSPPPTFFNDTWTWDGTTWTQQFPATSPPETAEHATAYDEARSQIVVFGGFNGSFTNDTWVWGAPSSSSPSFEEVVRNGVVQPHFSPGHIGTSFQPGCGLSLKEAAKLGGYDHFNWVQVVTFDSLILDCPLCAVLGGLTYFPPGSLLAVLPQIPYVDPPHGGYFRDGARAFSPVEDNLDWYWDERYTFNYRLPNPPLDVYTQLETETCVTGTPTCRVLAFEDEPECQITTVGFVCTVNFSTTLVGVRNSDGTVGEALNIDACETGVPLTCQNNVGTGFNWHVEGTTIGIDQRRQNFQLDTGTIVYFDGFKLPGAAGFTQPELLLFAKSGINIRDQAGVIIPLIIDIKPGEFPNNINPYAGGKIPVAILSTTSFDALATVDRTSLTFGRSGDEKSLAFCDGGKGDAKGPAGEEDVNGDRLPDLVCHFYNSTAGFQPGDTEGILKGKTLSGTSLFGKDSVRIVSPDKEQEDEREKERDGDKDK